MSKMSFATFLCVAVVVLLGASALPAPKVSANELGLEPSATKVKRAADTSAPHLRRKRTSLWVAAPSDFSDAAELEAQAENEADAELALLTDDDWFYVARVVESIAQQRALEQQQAEEELAIELAAQAMDDEAEDAPISDPVEIVVPDEEPELVIVPETAEEAIALSQQPAYVVVDDVDPTELESDPLVDELANELEAQSELQAHIDELAALLKDRYSKNMK